jgi:hypothetical protein
MAFGFIRRGGRQDAVLQGDSALVVDALDSAVATYGSEPDDFDLAVAIGDLIERAPTEDLRALSLEGLDEEEFYERELRPNWEGLSEGERAAKVKSFARFAHALRDDAPGGVAAVVRTKLIVLAWAYDRTYEADLLPRIDRKPDRFGRLELTPTR